jgi:hypothetical protein
MDAETSSERGPEMASLTDEMHESVVRLAGERGWHETREAWLARAARKAGISYRRAKTFFYRERTAFHAQDVEAVRAAIAKHMTGARHARREDTAFETAEDIDARIRVLAGDIARLSAELDVLRARVRRG